LELFDLPVVIVDKVTETGGVDDGKAETDTILLNVWRNTHGQGGVAVMDENRE